MAHSLRPARGNLRSRQPILEGLEDRSLPATFGLPWGNAEQLTVSFAPDGTAIAGHTNTLFQTLNAHQSTTVWQQQILNALQTWASKANINIGLKADGGQAFGIAGLNQHDPRFGDVRIAAQPMTPDVLAITVPSGSSLTGTWAGDLFLNSNTFSANNAPSLFGVALHEAGHVFGLGDSTDPKSPMYSWLSGATQPTSTDISNLQILYGARTPDSFEGSNGDDSINKAADIPIPGNHYQGDRPIALFADLTTTSDVDFYHIKPQSNYNGAMTVRLQTAGMSLMSPELTITDAKGNVLGHAISTRTTGDTVTVQLPAVYAGKDYYIKVDSKAGNAFAIGEYGLAVNFDGTNKTNPSLLDAALDGDDGLIASRDLDAIFRGDPRPFFNDDLHTNDVPLNALAIPPSSGFAKNSHYEVVGSLADATDVDYYQVTSAKAQSHQVLVMTATIRALAVNGTAPTATILDANQNPISGRVLANGNGYYTFQAIGITPESSYYVRIPGSSASSNLTGNYGVTIDFGTKASELTSFTASAPGTTANTQTYDLYVGESQMFEFLLTEGAAPAGTKVKMTVSTPSGTLLYTLTASVGQTVSGNALFLTPGAYVLKFVAQGITTSPALSYRLEGASITDPVGPSTTDPTLAPVYGGGGNPGGTPVFTYPGSVTTTKPYYLTLR